MAENLRQNRQTSILSAEFNITKPYDQKHRQIDIKKTCLFNLPFGFIYIIATPKISSNIKAIKNKNEKSIGVSSITNLLKYFIVNRLLLNLLPILKKL